VKSLIYYNPGEVRVVERPIPQIREGEVLIRVKYGGICGSDIKIMKGHHDRAVPGVILGHEFVGEIAEIKGNYHDIKVGDAVIVEPLVHCHTCYYCKTGKYNLCNEIGVLGTDLDGGFAEYVKIARDKVFKIYPEKMKKMALVEPLAVAVNAVNNCYVGSEILAVVLGGGTIGLLMAQLLRKRGARVIISEINDYRIKKAGTLGFTVFNPLKDDLEKEVRKLDKNGADLVIDAVGHPSVTDVAFRLVKKNGVINIIGISSEKFLLDLKSVVYSQLNIRGSFIYTFKDFLTARKLIDKDIIEVVPLISHIFPLNEAEKGFEVMKTGEDCLKVLLRI